MKALKGMVPVVPALLLSLLMFAVSVIFSIGPASAIGPKVLPSRDAGHDPESRRIIDLLKRIDVNEIDMFVTNLGVFGRDFYGGSGMFYPRGTDHSCMYSAGIWIGGISETEFLRVALAEYTPEYRPGTMIDGGGWNDPALERFHVYKLTPDSGPGDPDYDGWPVEDGAPLGRDGLPLRAGDQTLWSVCNDADPQYHTAPSGGTPPLGVEVSHLTYAYSSAGAPLDRVIVTDFRIWNRGTTSFHDVCATAWTDADLGGYSDDVCGSDSVLACAFIYNASNDDGVYGSSPPAVAFAALEGPGTGTNRAFSAISYRNGFDPNGAAQSYNYMRGLSQAGDPVLDPFTGRSTRFWYSGDPVTGAGWLDTSGGDKRMDVGVGPFQFVPGQVESIRVALVVGQGDDRIASVKDMKDAIRSIRRLNEKGAFPGRSQWAIAGPYPDPYDPTTGSEARVFVVAPTNGRISIWVRDEAEVPVRTLATDIAVDAGIIPIVWDGRNGSGDIVPPGTYHYDLLVLEPVPSSGQAIRDAEEIRIAYTSPPGSGKSASRIIHGGGWIPVDPTGATTRISIYDPTGRRVRSIEMSAGGLGVLWDGRDDGGATAPSGIYFVRGGKGLETERILLLR